jgi:toxin-antitoxin system PIN domain toxin
VPASIDLPDVNVWLALSVADHPHHDRARRYWYEEAAEQLAFCRITALGFLRLCTNDTVMGGAPLSVPEAWQAYRAFRSLREVLLAPEPPACESDLEKWVSSPGMTPRMWTDAYLAAFAVSGGMRLVSFDRELARFELLELLRLEH